MPNPPTPESAPAAPEPATLDLRCISALCALGVKVTLPELKEYGHTTFVAGATAAGTCGMQNCTRGFRVPVCGGLLVQESGRPCTQEDS